MCNNYHDTKIKPKENILDAYEEINNDIQTVDLDEEKEDKKRKNRKEVFE